MRHQGTAIKESPRSSADALRDPLRPQFLLPIASLPDGDLYQDAFSRGNRWADGIYAKVRLENDANQKQCMLALMGATADGKKELIAVLDG